MGEMDWRRDRVQCLMRLERSTFDACLPQLNICIRFSLSTKQAENWSMLSCWRKVVDQSLCRSYIYVYRSNWLDGLCRREAYCTWTTAASGTASVYSWKRFNSLKLFVLYHRPFNVQQSVKLSKFLFYSVVCMLAYSCSCLRCWRPCGATLRCCLLATELARWPSSTSNDTCVVSISTPKNVAGGLRCSTSLKTGKIIFIAGGVCSIFSSRTVGD